MTNQTEELIPIGNPIAELLEDLLVDLELSQTALATVIGTTPAKINDLLHGRRPLSAELAMRLGRYFGQSPQYWLNLQTEHQLRLAESEKGGVIAAEERPHVSAA